MPSNNNNLAERYVTRTTNTNNNNIKKRQKKSSSENVTRKILDEITTQQQFMPSCFCSPLPAPLADRPLLFLLLLFHIYHIFFFARRFTSPFCEWAAQPALFALSFGRTRPLWRAESGCAKRGGKGMKEFGLLPVPVLLLLHALWKAVQISYQLSKSSIKCHWHIVMRFGSKYKYQFSVVYFVLNLCMRGRSAPKSIKCE